ncbi:MAG TPA: GntR family transcriptional regulator, partial [Acidimicrobiales bacterium]|nr:GntR family transcriptional regulator [Acidimicrobiales bacterium]
MSEQYHLSGSTAASIAASIEDGIVSGTLAPGELLPPIRSLAAALGVSAGTVAAAYRLAGQRGLTLSDRRRGTRIRPWRREGGGPPTAATAPVSPTPPVSPTAVRDLASGTPDPRLLPPVAE